MVFCKRLTLLVLIYMTGGSFGAEVKSAIIGGQDARAGAWPWVVHLNITSNGEDTWRCGGTIINNQWVLTAAHCWDPHLRIDYSKSMVFLGAHSLQNPADRYMGILYAINHPDYRTLNDGYLNDISVVKMKKTIILKPGLVEKVSLPDDSPPSSDCWIVGWGDIRKNVPLPDPETLQQAQISIVPHSKCKEAYPQLESGMMCAGTDGDLGPCKGDYGGPLMCRGPSGFVQVGIMSYWGQDGCGLRGGPSIFTQVSKYVKFIKENIRRSEAASAEV